MGNLIKLTAILVVLCVLAASPGSFAQQPPAQAPPAASAPEQAAQPEGAPVAEAPVPAPPEPVKIDLPSDLQAFDLPNDDGTGVYLKWTALPGENAETTYTIYISENRDGPWLQANKDPIPADQGFMEDTPNYFPGFFAFGKLGRTEAWPFLGPVNEKKYHIAIIQNVQTEDKAGMLEYDRLGRPITIPQPVGFTVKPNTGPKMDPANGDGVAVDPAVIVDGKPKISQKLVVLAPRKIGPVYLKFTATKANVTAIAPEIFEVNAKENWFNGSKLNTFIFAILFGATILYFIARARRNANLFIRRIAGLNAVDEAIGRATEMGKPILYLNGMDALAGLSTLASLNILGRVARRVANYESSLTIPCRDPIVLTVAQEIVKAGYTDAGRPDSYNADNIFFLTDDQFSYSAGVCGIMLRDRPAANFFFGYYYAEALILTETGASTGAIQIAGTDAFTQLPFFVTTCDYTLIGEELYAASAYLSREPLILGSLKGQDMAKLFMMVVIIVGTILVTVGISFIKDLFTQMG